MNHDELFTSLHATTAGDLDGLLDIEAGLREALVAAQHTRTGDDLNLDIEAGLGAIIPPPDVAASSPATHPGHPSATPDRPWPEGATAARLRALDSARRLTLRNHPAITAFALILELTSAAATNRALDHALDVASDLELARDLDRDLELACGLARALDHDIGLARALDRASDFDRARDLTRDLTRARDLARDLTRDLSRARALTRNLANGLDFARDLAHDLTRSLTHGLTHGLTLGLAPGLASDLAHDLTLDLASDGDLDRASDLALDRASGLALDGARARARARARDLNLARNNFTDADFSHVDLTRVSLTGIRWSMATRWPSDEWRAQALLDSRDLGDGTYEIRGGTTNVATYST